MKILSKLLLLTLFVVVTGCSVKVPESNVADVAGVPAITPDYTGIVMPPNIAPMNFEINTPGDRYITVVEGKEGEPLIVEGKMVKFDMDD